MSFYADQNKIKLGILEEHFEEISRALNSAWDTVVRSDFTMRVQICATVSGHILTLAHPLRSATYIETVPVIGEEYFDLFDIFDLDGWEEWVDVDEEIPSEGTPEYEQLHHETLERLMEGSYPFNTLHEEIYYLRMSII